MRDWALQMRCQGDRAPALLHQPSMVLGCVHCHGATIATVEQICGSHNQAITSVPAASLLVTDSTPFRCQQSLFETIAIGARLLAEQHASQAAICVIGAAHREPAGRRSRPPRWHDAVGEMLALQAVYAAWLDVLPEPLQGTPIAEALQAIVEFDLELLTRIAPPRRSGRD